MNCGGCEENCTGDVRCHQCGEPMCPDVRGPGPGGEHFCSRECEEEWRAEMREQEPDEECEPLPAASCGGTTQKQENQNRKESNEKKIESDANVSLPRRASPAGDSVSAAETLADIERENTIYAGRNGEMTLDECIIRCDNNSGDNPRGRDVAQIGGWLRELRERRRAPGNAAAPQGPASAAPAAEPLSAILAEMRDPNSGFCRWYADGGSCDCPKCVFDALADRIEAAVASDHRKECEQCIRDRVRDEEMKTRAEQMSPAEETDLTLFEMRRAAENGRLAIKENPPVRSSLECYVDNTLAYANRLADSIARERRRAATKLSLAELHIKTLHKQFKHHGEIK